LILLWSVPFALTHAQEYLYEIGGMGGVASYMGDANKTAPFKGLNPALGVVFRYNTNFRVAFKGDLAWAKVSGSTEGLENVFPGRAQASFDRNLFELGGQFEFNFFPYSDKYAYLNTKRFTPYLLVGLGATVAPGNGRTFAGVNLPVGAGVKYKLKNRLNLGLEYSVRKLFGDGLDVTDDSNLILNNPYGISGSMMKNKDWYPVLTFSVTWDFGPRDCKCNRTDGIGF
jgi:opacity protein-like surface antigen